MTTIKRMNGFMETTHVEGNTVLYKRLRVNTPVQEDVEQAVQHEVVTTEYMTEEEWKESVMKEIMDRVAIKKEEYKKQVAMEEKVNKMMHDIDKLQREHRRRMRPKTTVHKVMDAIGIDRRRVYDMLCELEKIMM